MSTHTCPHDGVTVQYNGSDILCGRIGQLCPACREDRADARTDRLVEGLALVGLLANDNWTAGLCKALGSALGSDEVAMTTTRVARREAALLRERERGEG